MADKKKEEIGGEKIKVLWTFHYFYLTCGAIFLNILLN
jgi:hypothetical protein